MCAPPPPTMVIYFYNILNSDVEAFMVKDTSYVLCLMDDFLIFLAYFLTNLSPGGPQNASKLVDNYFIMLVSVTYTHS